MLDHYDIPLIPPGMHASPGPRRNFFATPAARIIAKEPRQQGGKNRALVPYRRRGVSFGAMIDAVVRSRPQARRLVNQMTKDQDFDQTALDVLADVAEIVLARTEVTSDFGEAKAVPVFDPKSRIAAAKAFLEFTRQKPKTVTQVEMTPEAWLERLDDEDGVDDDDAGD